nr:MAG: hypothetical protein [Caudoviricetes sp.]
MNIDDYFTKTGTVNTAKLRRITQEEITWIEQHTSFLQLDPKISSRLRVINSSIIEHPKCPCCGTYLKFSPSKESIFVEYCSISCAKKSKPNNIEKFQNSLENKKKIYSEVYENSNIEPIELVQEFFKQNLEVFKGGGSKGKSLLESNPSIHKSLDYYTTSEKLNAKIYELLYGPGKCKECGVPTKFKSLENGFYDYCEEHGKEAKRNGSITKGLNSIGRALDKLRSFDNFNEFEIVDTPNKLNGLIILKHDKCGETFNLFLGNGKLNNYILRCGNCQNTSISSPELEIRNWLTDNNVDHIPQYKINSKKIDIVIPNKKLAIEHNGLMDHSFGKSKYSRFNNSCFENPNNHLERTILCESEGLKLLHIFENEWLNKTSKQIWKSIISTNLGLNEKIYARKCEIKEIKDNNLIRIFLNENHLQGYCKSSIKIGLFYNNELVSLMTFGKPRFNKKYEWELIRFCNKINFSVVGGSSRLFKYFVNNYHPKDIISYCDIRVFSGEMYESLGFELSHSSKPNYFYIKGMKFFSRYSCQKHKLEGFLVNFDSKKSERDNMFNNGYRRIWDCGNKVYVWGRG